jgi:hypothetical protein
MVVPTEVIQHITEQLTIIQLGVICLLILKFQDVATSVFDKRAAKKKKEGEEK